MTEPEILNMPLEEAMRTQRAIRRLKPDPVDDGLVLHLIELALKAPTGSNAQNWEFVVVKDRTVKARLGALNRRAWNVYGGIGRRMAKRAGDQPTLRIIDAVGWQADHFVEIPVLVVACLKGFIPPWPPIATASMYGSIFPSVQNLLLAARAAGLGAALITAAAVEPFSGAPRAWPALERRSLRSRAAGLADRTLRTDPSAPGPRGGLPRPLRQSRFPRHTAGLIGTAPSPPGGQGRPHMERLGSKAMTH